VANVDAGRTSLNLCNLWSAPPIRSPLDNRASIVIARSHITRELHQEKKSVEFKRSIAAASIAHLFTILKRHRPESLTARSGPTPFHIERVGLGYLRLRASDEHSFIVRVPRAKKAPSLIPVSSSATHSPSPDSPCRRSLSSPGQLRIRALAVCPL
jgi:hypothetical protein